MHAENSENEVLKMNKAIKRIPSRTGVERNSLNKRKTQNISFIKTCITMTFLDFDSKNCYVSKRKRKYQIKHKTRSVAVVFWWNRIKEGQENCAKGKKSFIQGNGKYHINKQPSRLYFTTDLQPLRFSYLWLISKHTLLIIWSRPHIIKRTETAFMFEIRSHCSRLGHSEVSSIILLH